MADINALLPTAPVQAVARIGQQVNTTELRILDTLTSDLAVVSGTIIGKDSSGNFLLKTNQGNLSLQSDLPLTYNSDLVIRVDNNTANNTSTARIISVNGETVTNDSQPQVEGDSVNESALAKTIIAEPATAEKLQKALNGQLIRAVVTESRPLTLSTAVPLTEQAVHPNTPILIHIPHPQETAFSSDASAQTEVVKEDIKNNTQGKTKNAANENKVILKSSDDSTPHVAADTEEEIPETPEQPNSKQAQKFYAAYSKQSSTYTNTPVNETTQKPEALTLARLVSINKDNTATLQTGQQQITVKTEAFSLLAKLPPQTDIVLELPAETTPAASPASQPAPLVEIASNWTTFKDIVQSILGFQGDAELPTTSNPATPTQGKPSLSSFFPHLPVLGENFVASSFAFIANLSKGNYQALLGDDVIANLKKNGKENLVEKFISEAASFGTTLSTNSPSQSSANGQWQTLFLPFIAQDTLQQARIYVKPDSENKKNTVDGKSTTGTRFVVEVNLPDLGGLQLDGLVRKTSASTFFDLVIRSNNALQPVQQKEITDIYHTIAAQTGFVGTLSFQTTPDFPVKPLDDIAKETNSIISYA